MQATLLHSTDIILLQDRWRTFPDSLRHSLFILELVKSLADGAVACCLHIMFKYSVRPLPPVEPAEP